MPVCHGQSGSGVFRPGTNELLGVMIHGARTRVGGDRVLCDPIDKQLASGNESGFVHTGTCDNWSS